MDESKVADAAYIPYPGETFDIVFACNLLEHIIDPDSTFNEVFRVLKAGGVFLIKTPNKNHFLIRVAYLTPLWFHKWFNKKRGRAEVDTFPKYYKVNTPASINKLAKKSGLRVCTIDLIEGRPEYMRINVFTYILGFIYERLVNLVPLFKTFRILIIAELFKPE